MQTAHLAYMHGWLMCDRNTCCASLSEVCLMPHMCLTRASHMSHTCLTHASHMPHAGEWCPIGSQEEDLLSMAACDAQQLAALPSARPQQKPGTRGGRPLRGSSSSNIPGISRGFCSGVKLCPAGKGYKLLGSRRPGGRCDIETGLLKFEKRTFDGRGVQGGMLQGNSQQLRVKAGFSTCLLIYHTSNLSPSAAVLLYGCIVALHLQGPTVPLLL